MSVHDDVLDLVAISLDFEMTPDETAEIEDHLASCAMCEDEAKYIRDDDEEWFDKFDWEDALEDKGGQRNGWAQGDSSHEADEMVEHDPTVPVWDKDRLDGGQMDVDTSEDVDPNFRRSHHEEDFEEDGQHQSAEGEADPRDTSPSKDASDEDDQTSTPSRSDAHDAPGRVGRDHDDADDDADDDEDGLLDREDPLAAEGVDDFRDNPISEDEDEDGLDMPSQDDEAAAAEEARGMSDEELANEEADNPLIPSCAAEGVNSVKRVSDQDKRDAEETIKTARNQEQDGRGNRVDVCTSARKILTGAQADVPASQTAASAIRNALIASRTGTTGVERTQPRGRLDSKGLYRIAMQDYRVFQRRHAPDPGKFLIWVMVDVSGSMTGTPIYQAAATARALAQATTGVPNVRMAVWGWSSPFRHQNYRYGGYSRWASAGVAKVWESGMDLTRVSDLVRLSNGGTPDGTVLSWAWRAAVRAAKPGEKVVIMMLSDGDGEYEDSMKEVVADAGKQGVMVRSVAIGEDVDPEHQLAIYGRRGFVPWMGSIDATARPLGQMVGRFASGQESVR